MSYAIYYWFKYVNSTGILLEAETTRSSKGEQPEAEEEEGESDDIEEEEEVNPFWFTYVISIF